MSAARPPRRVFIVDDEPGVRELLQLICESAELGITTYESAEAFLAGNAAPSCDLIVLDIDMPGMSGLELLKTLKERGYAQPVVMMSGGHDESKKAAAKEHGAAAFFDKPFSVRAVGQCIGELLGHYPGPCASTQDSASGQTPVSTTVDVPAGLDAAPHRSATGKPPQET